MRNKLPFLLVLALIVSSALWVSPASADSGTDPFTLSQSGNELSSGNTQASIQSLAWYDGLIQYSSILNCASIIGGFPYIEYGMGTYVGFIADPEAAAPGINQVYYVHVVVAGLGNSCAGQRAFIDVQLPANTSLAITPSTPVHCFAGGNPISPPSSCPQTLPASPFNPGAFAIYSPDAANNYTWPMPQGAFWEFQIPVKSTTALTGSPFRANVLAMDGYDNPWLRPEIGVFVFSSTPTVIYPSPSTEITQNPDLSYQYKSQAYIYTFNQTGTAYFDLGTSPGYYNLKTDAIPISNPGTAWYIWDDWVDPPFNLLPNTTYYWRARFLSSGGQTYLGAEQSFSTFSSGLVTLGNGTPASCTTSSLNTALNTPGLKTLNFDCGAAPVSITMAATKSVTSALVIDGGKRVILNAPPNSRHFDVSGGVVFTLKDITLTGGNPGSGCGGAVRVSGNSLFISNHSSFINNTSPADGGALCVITGSQAELNSSLFQSNTAALNGGAVASQGALSILWTDISRNTAGANGGGVFFDSPFAGTIFDFRKSLAAENVAAGASSKGGGIYLNGIAEINTSTIALNSSAEGAGIYNLNSTPFIESSTIANNRAASGTGGILAAGAANFTLHGTIVAHNLPQNCAAGQIVSQGYNLENTNQCAFNAVGDKKNLNPLLDRLRYNGGASRTMYLKPGSPAIDAGDPGGCGQFDQRGFYGNPGEVFFREADGNGDGIKRCDIGAFELLPDDNLITDIFLPFLRR